MKRLSLFFTSLAVFISLCQPWLCYNSLLLNTGPKFNEHNCRHILFFTYHIWAYSAMSSFALLCILHFHFLFEHFICTSHRSCSIFLISKTVPLLTLITLLSTKFQVLVPTYITSFEEVICKTKQNFSFFTNLLNHSIRSLPQNI